MRKRVGLVAVVVVVAIVFAVLVRRPISQPGLAHELIRMQREDHERALGGAGFFGGRQITLGPDALGNPQLEEINKIRQRHADRFKVLVAKYGWPTEKMVGREGVYSALGQLNNFFYPEYVAEILPQVLRSGEHSQELARLVDRTAVAQNQPQTYATQWTCRNGVPEAEGGVIDEANLDARRRAFGLQSIEAEKRQMTKFGFCAGIDERVSGENGTVIIRPTNP